MKKIIFVLFILMFVFITGCDNKKEETETNIEEDPQEDIKEENQEEPSNQDNEENDSNVDDNTEEKEEETYFEFSEDDFKYEIIIVRTSDNYKKVFKEEDYLDFYDVIKEYKYHDYGQCISCTDPIYEISYNDNKILVYEYSFFKINDKLFELVVGSFDFLSDYEYSNSESSGWLPWI